MVNGRIFPPQARSPVINGDALTVRFDDQWLATAVNFTVVVEFGR
jgi:hypothetical protein